MFLVQIDTPLGTSLAKTNEVTRYVEGELAKQPNIVNYATNVGKGNPRIHYNVGTHNESPNYAEIFVQTKPNMHLTEIEGLVNTLRQHLNDYPNAKIQVKQFDQGPPRKLPLPSDYLVTTWIRCVRCLFELKN